MQILLMLTHEHIHSHSIQFVVDYKPLYNDIYTN